MRRIQSTHFDLQLKLDSSNSSNTLLHWGTKQVVLLATWLSCCVLLVLLLISEQHLLPSINRHTSKSVRPAQFTKYTRFLRQSSSMSSTQAVHQDQSTVKLASEEPQIDELWNAMPFTKVVKAEGARYDYQHEPSHSNELHQQSAYHETLQQAGVTQQQQQQHQRPPLQLPHLSFLSDRDIIILLDYIRELNAYNITPEAATAGYLQAFETVTPLFHDSPWQVKNSAKAWQQQQQPSGFASHDLANARGNGALGSSSSSSSSSSAVHQYSQTQNATNAAEQLMTYALLLLKASHKLVHCGTEDSSMPPLPHQQRDRLLLAAVLSEGSGSSSAAAAAAAGRRGGGVTGGFTKADDAMPNFVLQVVTFALQYPSESLFVSIVHDTGGSSDSSEGDSSSSVVSFWLDVLQLLLLPLRVPVLVSKTSDVMQQQWGLGASGVEQQAALRNLALDPFVQLQHKGNSSSSSSGGSSCAHSSGTSGDAVVQSNDSTPAAATAQQLAACFDPEWLLFVDGGVLFCKSDLHRIMMHDQADLACGWDLRMAEPAPIPAAAAAGHNVGSSSSSTDNTAAAAAAAVRQDEPNVIDPTARNNSSSSSSSVMNAAESHVDPNVAAAAHKADYSNSKTDAQTTSLQTTGLTAPAAAAAAAGAQRHLQQQQQQTVHYGVLSINQLQQQQQHHQAQPTSTPAATAAQATTAQQQQQQQQRQRLLAVPPSGRPSLHTLLQYPFYYGDAAVGRLVTGGLFDVVPPYAAAAHMPTQSRLAAGLPVQVHCCWSGFAKTRAEPFRRGLRFRSHQPSECKATAQNLMCDDLHRLGFSKVLIDSGVLVTRQLQLSARISNSVKQGRRMPYIRRSRWLEVQGAGSPWFQGHQNHHHQQQQDERSRFSTCCEGPTERFGMSSSSSSSSSNADDVVGGAVSKLGLSDSLSNILYAVGFGNSKGNQQLNTVNRFSREGFSDRQYRVHQSPSGALTLQEFLRAALMQSGKATVADLGLYSSSSGTKGATAAVEGTEAEAQCRLMDILARNFTEGYLWQARQRQQQEVV